jgi:hypothetical protein
MTTGRNTVTWVVDSEGATLSSSGNLRQVYSGAGRSSAEKTAQGNVGMSGLSGDQGGHLVDHRFVLDKGEINMFPQETGFNNSAFRILGGDYARYVRQGYEVNFNHILGDFDVATGRPGSLLVNFDVTDGFGNLIDSHRQLFQNQAGQTYVRRAYP